MNDLEFNSEEEDLNRGNLNHFAGDLQSFNRTNEHHSDLEDIPEVDEVDNGIKGHSHVIAPEDGLTSLSDIASDYVFDGRINVNIYHNLSGNESKWPFKLNVSLT